MSSSRNRMLPMGLLRPQTESDGAGASTMTSTPDTFDARSDEALAKLKEVVGRSEQFADHDGDSYASYSQEEFQSGIFYPWWFRLGGGGANWWCSRRNVRDHRTRQGVECLWQAWAVLYCLGVWTTNLWNVYYSTLTDSPSVFGISVVVVPLPDSKDSMIKIVMDVAVLAISLCHLYGYLFVVIYTRTWRALDGPPNDKSVMAASWGFIFSMFLSLVLMLIGNIANPGQWSVFVNVVFMGFAGTFFVWMPFLVPLIMFFLEMHSHATDICVFCTAVANLKGVDQDIDILRQTYFVIYRGLRSTSRRYSLIVPVWLVNVGFASSLNFLLMFYQPGDVSDYSVLIFCVQVINLVIFSAITLSVFWVNQTGSRVLSVLARHEHLVPLAVQVQFCPLKVMLGYIQLLFYSGAVVGTFMARVLFH